MEGEEATFGGGCEVEGLRGRGDGRKWTGEGDMEGGGADAVSHAPL